MVVGQNLLFAVDIVDGCVLILRYERVNAVFCREEHNIVYGFAVLALVVFLSFESYYELIELVLIETYFEVERTVYDFFDLVFGALDALLFGYEVVVGKSVFIVHEPFLFRFRLVIEESHIIFVDHSVISASVGFLFMCSDYGNAVARRGEHVGNRSRALCGRTERAKPEERGQRYKQRQREKNYR